MSELKSSDIEFSQNQNEEFCDDCHLSKAKKKPHIVKSQNAIDDERKSGVREGVIHSDLMGAMKIKTLSGCRYVLTYICSHTEFSYVYLMKQKSEQFEFFKEFKSLYENQTGFKIRELRTDNGTEYFSNKFVMFETSDNGIKHQTSVAYVPESNGKAERLNRTLLEKARAMLATSKLDQYMWGAAIVTANYLRNRSPCKSINFKTPYELVYNKLPALAHLKVFGCKAFPLILNQEKSKFQPTAQANCVMVGYDESDGIYWIFNKSKKTIFRSRDVTFHEQIPEKRNGIEKCKGHQKHDEWFKYSCSFEIENFQSEAENENRNVQETELVADLVLENENEQLEPQFKNTKIQVPEQRESNQTENSKEIHHERPKRNCKPVEKLQID